MNLLLTSSGLTNEVIVDALAELSTKPLKESSVTFVPTAANLEESDKSWLIDDLCQFRRLQFKSIDIVDLAALPSSLVKRRISAANIVVFGGGDPYYLLDWIETHWSKDEFLELFAHRVYVGISAGTQVATPHLALASESSLFGAIGGQQDPWRKGLHLVDAYIRPHLNSPDFPCAQLDALESVVKLVSKPTYGVDDNSALKIVDGDIEIVTTGEVIVFAADS